MQKGPSLLLFYRSWVIRFGFIPCFQTSLEVKIIIYYYSASYTKEIKIFVEYKSSFLVLSNCPYLYEGQYVQFSLVSKMSPFIKYK